MLPHSWIAWRVGWYSSVNESHSSSAAVIRCIYFQQFFFVWCYFSNKVFVLPVLETFGMLEEKIRCVVRRVLCSCYNFPKEEKNFNVYGATNKVNTVLQWSTQVSWGSSWNHQHGFQQDYHLLHNKSLKTSRSFEIILYSVEHNVRKPILCSYLVIYVCVCVCV